ncbi:MAG: PQQ-binding-like beta-propeller repeat protein [Fuerstiella sp.]
MHRITRRQSLAGLAGGMVALGLPTCSHARQDSPGLTPPTETSWASFRNGPAQRGLAGCQLADQPSLKWELKSRDGWIATCAIVGNHVYAPALQGWLYCLDRETGREIWRYRSIESVDETKFAPGFKAAPLVTEAAVYLGDEDGVLHAIGRATGALMWKFTTGAEIAGGVAVYGRELLLASHDSQLYCLSESGQEKWNFQTDDMINCSPGVAEHFTFLSGCDAQLRVIDLNTGDEVRNVPMASQLVASPAIVGDMLYVGSHAGDFSAVNWKTGEIVWRYQGDREMPYHASAAATDELILVGSHDKLMHAIDRQTGKPRWTFATKARVESSAAVVGDRVFFGSGDGNIYGLNLQDGRQIWKFNAGKPVNAGIAIGEGCLVVGEDDHNGTLRCFA